MLLRNVGVYGLYKPFGLARQILGYFQLLKNLGEQDKVCSEKRLGKTDPECLQRPTMISYTLLIRWTTGFFSWDINMGVDEETLTEDMCNSILLCTPHCSIKHSVEENRFISIQPT